MAAQSIEYTRRQLSRAKTTANKILAAPDGEQVVLKALAPDVIAVCDAFDAADADVRAGQASAAKEIDEGEKALGNLKKLFDQTREVIAVKLPVSYEAASSFYTPDDLLNAAEDMEATLESADQQWAAPVLSTFSTALEAANKEHQESAEARKVQQKLAADREVAEGAARPIFVRFRRALRASFGSSSREYRELLDRRSRGSDDPVPEVTSPS